MSDPVDQEIEAIRCVLAALQPLSKNARASVLEYVTKRLSIASTLSTPPAEEIPPPPLTTYQQGESSKETLHIKEFKEQKKPRSANEMAAVVAYYLENIASPDKRKSTVNHKDIETYFKIAQFPLPKRLRVTLANARNAGYFDLSGNGEFKLNAVGHNLVVHSMPRGSAASTAKRATRRKKTTKKKKTAKSRRKSSR